MFTVGMVQENAYLVRRDGSDRALMIDPGDEAPRLLGAIDALGLTLRSLKTERSKVGAWCRKRGFWLDEDMTLGG